VAQRSPVAGMKRLLDFLVALVALYVLTLPMLAIALWIKVDSPGPVLFRQVRVGRWGNLFHIWKFRTMVADAPARGLAVTAAGDPRITRAGRLLRATKLDELPQLFNVLLGQMSLVGPRPEVPQYVALYPPQLREQVLSVRPGLTDPVSLAYADEAQRLAAAADPEREYREVIMPAKLQAAAAYVARASLWTDLRVLLRTAARALTGRLH
jgi:lipopolysaccharide/colanic/teichoic acid biosynthesis glycosyltransferase